MNLDLTAEQLKRYKSVCNYYTNTGCTIAVACQHYNMGLKTFYAYKNKILMKNMLSEHDPQYSYPSRRASFPPPPTYSQSSPRTPPSRSTPSSLSHRITEIPSRDTPRKMNVEDIDVELISQIRHKKTTEKKPKKHHSKTQQKSTNRSDNRSNTQTGGDALSQMTAMMNDAYAREAKAMKTISK